MKRILPLICALHFFTVQTYAQSIELTPTVIASAGSYSEAGGISLSWTLGEIAVTSLSNGNIILTQGFQQSFLGDVGLDVNPVNWKIAAYPNPVRDELKLQFELPEAKEFFIEIHDIYGRLVSQEQYKQIFPRDVIKVEMSSFMPGVYFFRVSTADLEQVRVLTITKL